jgi:predicted nucleotidyltransferase
VALDADGDELVNMTDRGAPAYNGDMAKIEASPFPFPPKRMYFGAKVPRRLIHRYADAIAAEFHPDKIVLFGSYAYGTPHEASDVDLLVVMPTPNPHDQVVRIQYRLTAPFPVDLIVRTPQQLALRLSEGESFLTTVMSRGKVLYEKDDAGVGRRPFGPGRRQGSVPGTGSEVPRCGSRRLQRVLPRCCCGRDSASK